MLLMKLFPVMVVDEMKGGDLGMGGDIVLGGDIGMGMGGGDRVEAVVDEDQVEAVVLFGDQVVVVGNPVEAVAADIVMDIDLSGAGLRDVHDYFPPKNAQESESSYLSRAFWETVRWSVDYYNSKPQEERAATLHLWKSDIGDILEIWRSMNLSQEGSLLKKRRL